MTSAMEMHDSWLRDLKVNPDGTGYALFHACIFRSEGIVFQDAQESGWQTIRFDFKGMRTEGELVDLTFDPYASDGALWINGRKEDNIIHLPANHVGDLSLEMRLNPSFELFKIRASEISSTLLGDFELEETWDADGTRTRA